MRYREMTVWCCGDEKAKNVKTRSLMFGITFILLCIFHMYVFIVEPYDEQTTLIDHLIFGLFFIAIIGWLTALMFISCIYSFRDIAKNKKIKLYLFKLKEFAIANNFIDDKVIIFADENGIVLADEENEKEAKIFCFDTKSFCEFEKFYSRHEDIEKREVFVDKEIFQEVNNNEYT